MAEGSGAPRGRGASGSRTGGGNPKTSKVARGSSARTSSPGGARTSSGRTSGTTSYGRGRPSSGGAGQDARGSRGGAPRTSSGDGRGAAPAPPLRMAARAGLLVPHLVAPDRQTRVAVARPRADPAPVSSVTAPGPSPMTTPATAGVRRPVVLARPLGPRRAGRPAARPGLHPAGRAGLRATADAIAGRLLVTTVPLRRLRSPPDGAPRRTLEGLRGTPDGRYRHRLRRAQTAIRGRRFLQHPPKVRCWPSRHQCPV